MSISRTSLFLALLASLVLSACGGGEGSAPAPAANTSVGLIAAPSGFDFANFHPLTRTSAQLITGVGGFTVSNAQRTYVSLYYLDGSGQHQQLAFLSLSGAQALDAAGGVTVMVPGGISSVHYDIYDASQTRSGEATL